MTDRPFEPPMYREKPEVIKSLTAFVSVDAAGNEGVIAELMPTGIDGQPTWTPLIGADELRIRSMRPIAERVAQQTGRSVKLIRFSLRQDLEEIR